MVLLGLSILAISLSFLFYRHSSAWTFLQRLTTPSIQDATAKQEHDAPTRATNHERQEEEKAKAKPKTTQDEPVKELDKTEQDRMMMPPPALPRKKPTSPTTPRASAASQDTKIPSFNLAEASSSKETSSRPLFPAANSAQRAGANTSTRARALPAFPALNSAQRASPGTNAPPRLAPLPQAGGLMPPPSAPRSSLPNRGPPSLSSSSLFPPPTHTSIPSKPSKKVLLTPGHSPLDWARLTASNPTLNGLPANSPYLRVPPSLLKTMTGRKGKDAWTVLGGKVYNISPYAPYHPGGVPELMRAAGRDGTRLFGEIHPWVNWEGMLEGCLVGIAVDEAEVKSGGNLEEMD